MNKQKIKNVGKVLARDLCKFTYPILGNLSRKVQLKLEDTLGKDAYNSEDAVRVSAGINTLVYSILAAYAGSTFEKDNIIKKIMIVALFSTPALCFGYYESKVRSGKYTDSLYASIPGKILSLPLEYMISVNQRSEEIK